MNILFSASAFTWLAVPFLLHADGPPKLRLSEVENMAPTSYEADLQLNPDQLDFAGSISIQIHVVEPVSTIWLNANKLTVKEATVSTGGKIVQAKVLSGGEDFLGLQLDGTLPAGNAEIRISYTGVVRQNASAGIFQAEDAGTHYLITQFESTDARDAFPCFDEPSYKVPWQLTLHVPTGSVAVNNSAALSESNEGATHTYRFAKTKPLPSYLVAFAVGPFEFVDAGKAGRNHIPVRIVTPKGKAAEAKYAAEVTSTIINRLEDYFGIPFPYAKSDQLAIPVTFGFGAMENAGLVTYSQNLILAKPGSDTVNRQRGYASVAAHELAHQWFGDLVTTAWWNDIWLNEAFATWTEQKILAEWKPEWQSRVSDVGSKLGAEGQDSLVSARKIRQEILAKDDISNAFDGITYQKGAAVIGMFESWLGPEDFRKGVQSYMKQYAFKNASAGDFLDSLSTSSKKNVTAAFSTFLNQAGVPLLSVGLNCNQGAPTLHLEQMRFVPLGSTGSTAQVWNIPVCVRYGAGETGKGECTLMKEPAMDWKLNTQTCPTWVEANDRAVGYYRVDYQGGLLDALTSGNVEKRLTAAERVDLMGNAESLTGDGKLQAADALKLVATFHNDPDRYVAQRSLSLATAPRELVPESLMPNYQRFLQKNFGARARELGWTPKPGEPDDASLLRPGLLRTMATSGGDKTLASEAQTLTEKWFANHSAVDPNMTGAVLGTAAYYGDKALFERFLAEFQKAQDRQERQRIQQALGSFRDPAAIEAGYNAVLSGKIPFIQGGQLLFNGQESEKTRKMPFEFLKAHYDEIVAKRPQGGGRDFGAGLVGVGRSYCDAESRNELKTYFETRATQFTGGPRSLANTLERIDVCIARRAAQQPSVVAFLEKE